MWRITLGLGLLLMGLSTFAISLDIIDEVDIKAIKRIHLEKKADGFWAEVTVQFSNGGPAALKFKQADFVITFKEGEKQQIYLGNTHIDEIIFVANQKGEPQLTEYRLAVLVGEDNLDTVTRLVQLFNLIANPNSEFSMVLTGSTEVGVKAKRGWVYQGRINLEEFVFYPTIQREVLFK